MKHLKKIILTGIAMALAVGMTGCGSAEVTMKEFTSKDETVSIMLNDKWTVEDMGMDNWLSAGNASGTEAAVVMQMEKSSSGIGNMDDVKEVMEESYELSELKEVEKPEIPGMTDIEAFTGKMNVDNANGDCYIVYGKTDYAYYAIIYVANKMNDRKLSSYKTSCESFKENAPEIVNNSQVAMTDTIQWINATYSVLTYMNSWDYNLYGGLPANDDSMETGKSLLEEWWEVTDRASADETMEWILTEGHRTGFAADMESLIECGIADVAEEERVQFLQDNFELTEELAAAYANGYAAYETYGEDTIAAWDYSRAMSLLSYYYIAGYYTETEALDMSLELAAVIQSSFDSWDAFMESYLIGYEYWAEESSEERRAAYEELKAASDSPFAVDWNLTLEKSW